MKKNEISPGSNIGWRGRSLYNMEKVLELQNIRNINSCFDKS